MQRAPGQRISRRESKIVLIKLPKRSESKGLRQMEVASRLGKPQSYVSKYEPASDVWISWKFGKIRRAVGLCLTGFSRRIDALV